MARPTLLTTGPMMALIEDGIANAFIVERLHEAKGDRQAFLRRIGPHVRAICTGSHTGVRTDAAMMDLCPGLKIIGNFGVGYDTIDIPAAAQRGIVITNTPDVLTEEVADTTLGLLLGTVLGAIDGATAWFTPEVRPEMATIIIGSTFKGLVAGILIGFFSRKVKSASSERPWLRSPTRPARP